MKQSTVKIISTFILFPFLASSFTQPRSVRFVQVRNCDGMDLRGRSCRTKILTTGSQSSRFSLSLTESAKEADGKGRSTTLSKISSIRVKTIDAKDVSLGTFLPAQRDKTAILACLSHFGDFNAWEVAQQYIAAINLGRLDSDCDVVLVGIGSAGSAKIFSEALDLGSKQIELVADETGAVTEALGCYRGWLAVDKKHAERWPSTDINPYLKLFGMIFGFGSPGTIGRVLYGYVGDKDGGVQSRKWVVDALLQGSQMGRFPQITDKAFDGVPKDSGLRPFELATLRAQTGIYIVLNWAKLGPKDGDLFTRMGGTFVFNNGECMYDHFDKGILTYADIGDVVAATKKS